MIGAFFDIDGTLFRNSLLIEHFKKMIKFDYIDIRVWTENGRSAFHEWEIRKGDYEEYLLDISEAYRKSLTGIENRKIDFLAEMVIEKNWEKTYVYTRDRIKFHKKNNHMLFFISGSPDFLVKKMAEKYGADDFRGSKYIMENDCFSGDIIPMWDSESKEKAIKELKEKYNIDLINSYAYGDTTGDISMFESVGFPIIINPNKKLYEYVKNSAKLSDANIVVERKDVIYKIR